MATLLLGPQKTKQAEAPERPAPSMPRMPRDSAFQLERGLALMLITVAAVYLRARDPLYNTAYMDESVYVVYGRMFLARHFEAPLDTPLQWSFGWYLWPMMAAIADRIGGLLALRELAAGLGTVTVAAMYGFASRVFSKTVGLAAAAVMAVLAPAILVSRIATRDSGSICFFALALWAFAAAWHDNKKRQWMMAALFLFAAFLCKYLVAIFFPAMVLLSLWKGKKPWLLFALPLTAACAAYLTLNWGDLKHLLFYGSAYGSLRGDAFNIYIAGRRDLMLIGWLAVLPFVARGWRTRTAWLWLGALTALAFQWKTRADYDFWKHANYILLFLVPAAVAGLLFLAREMFRRNYLKRMMWGMTGVLALAAGAALLGNAQNFEQFVFWPNVSPALAYFDGKLTTQDRVLVDDTVFRYYFNPTLHQPQISDPMYFHYHDRSGNDLFGEQAYQTAVTEKAFSYVVLDGGMGDEALKMEAAIRPALSGYQLQMRAVDPIRGHDIEIYSREAAATETANPSAPGIRLLTPQTGAQVDSANVMAEGVATGAQPDWYARIEVFTNRWWPQGEAVPVDANGNFRQAISLGGVGRQRCFHLVRASLIDNTGRRRAVTLNHDIAREDGAESCNPPAAQPAAAAPPTSTSSGPAEPAASDTQGQSSPTDKTDK